MTRKEEKPLVSMDDDEPVRSIEEIEAMPSIELSAAEKDAIRREARKAITEERKQQLKRILMEQYIREERAKLDPELAEVIVSVELPPFTDRIMLDGVSFLHGREYPMSRRKANTMNEIMEMAWRHDDIAFGRRAANERRRDAGRHSAGISMNQHGVVTGVNNFLRL